MKTLKTTQFDQIHPLLVEVESRMLSSPGYHHPGLNATIERLLSAGGKRIRPTLALLTGMMLGAEYSPLLDLAAAIEMVHSATLVHDDLIDGALVRRGIPTLNAEQTPGATVLSGDYMFARAAHLAARTRSTSVINAFAKTLMIIVDGEFRQMFPDESFYTRKQYFNQIYAKTASLFELCTVGAAYLSPCNPDQIESLRLIGRQIGLSFQILDDVFDYIADEKELGKPIGSDLRQGLLTLPAIYYREVNPHDPDLDQIIKGEKLSDGQISRLIDTIKSSNAIELAQDDAQRAIDVAQDQLAAFPSSSERQSLYELTEYVLNRAF